MLCALALAVLLTAGGWQSAAHAQARMPITIQPNMGAIDVSGGVQFSPDGRYLAIGNGTQIKLWDSATGLPLRILEHSAYFAWFAIIDDGQRIASLHKDGQLRFWDPLTGKVVASAEIPGVEPPMMAVAHHAESKLIAVATNNGSLIVWDYASGRQRGEIRLSADTNIGVDAVQFSRDGTQAVVSATAFGGESGSSVTVFDIATHRRVRTTRLPRQGDLRPLALLDETWLIAKTEWTDCRADVVLMRLVPGVAAPTTIDRAPGCQGAKEDASFDSIRVLLDPRADRLYLSRAGVPGFKVWDLAAGRMAGDARGVAGKGWLVGIDRSLASAVLDDGQNLRIADLGDGRTISTLAPGHGQSQHYAIASADGRQIMLHQRVGAVERLTVWPISGISPRFHSVTLPPGFETVHAVPDSNLLLGSDLKSRFVVHSILTGERLSAFAVPGLAEVNRARLSPDGKWILLTSSDQGATYLVEARTGKIARKLRPRRYRWDGMEADPSAYSGAFAFSADGKRFAVAWWSFGVEIWNLEPLRLIKGMDAPQATAIAFSADGKTLAVGSRDEGVYTLSAETGRKLGDFGRDVVAGHVSTGSVALSADGALVAAGAGQRAVSSGDIGAERRVQVWDAASGKVRHLLSGHEANVNALVFTAGGRWLVSGSSDGTIRYWSRTTGQLAATFAAAPDGRWVIVTDKGFFAGSANAGDLMAVVRGFEATHMDRLRQSLYAPDLVRSYLAGDPEGEVAAAEAHKDLAAILDSGPAPTVRIALPPGAERSSEDVVTVTAHVSDRGKGVGRIEWRVNGITAAVASRPDGAGPAYALTREIALDPGENVIEVVAYNAGNLLASPPAHTVVKLAAPANKARPRLHILAIGINAYIDTGWTPAGGDGPVGFPPLSLAVKDATAFAAAMQQAAGGLYDDVRVTLALDRDAARDRLNAIVAKLAAEVHPRDSFILFAAAHGISEDGRFYLIPRDYQSGPGHLAKFAIGQDDLQDWLANRIKARKAIVLLDTCESGALVAGHARSRVDGPVSEAGVGRLHEATGRPVLTAAALGQEATEGEIGATGERHGFFTWAVLDALRKADSNANGLIELSELVAHVQDIVPKIATRKGIRGLATITAADKQSARFGSRGEDFVVVERLK